MGRAETGAPTLHVFKSKCCYLYFGSNLMEYTVHAATRDYLQSVWGKEACFSGLSDFILYSISSSFKKNIYIKHWSWKGGSFTTEMCSQATPEPSDIKRDLEEDAVTGRPGWNLREAHFLPYLWMLHLSLWRGTWGSSHACACGWSDVPLTGSAAAHQHRKRDVKGCVQLCDTRDDFLS